MINVNDIFYLTSEDYINQVKEISASIREQLNDIDILTDKFIKDGYLNQIEVAEYLHCSVQQIPREIPCAHIGRMWLYRRSDIEKFMSVHRKRRDDK